MVIKTDGVEYRTRRTCRPVERQTLPDKGAGVETGDSKKWWWNYVECADGLDWGELAGELRNLIKFNAEIRFWWMIVKTDPGHLCHQVHPHLD